MEAFAYFLSQPSPMQICQKHLPSPTNSDHLPCYNACWHHQTPIWTINHLLTGLSDFTIGLPNVPSQHGNRLIL